MFRSIIKNNAIFGSVQLANILIQLIKGKLIAIILGASGYGLIAMYNGFLDLGVSATMLGTNTSAVSILSRVRNKSLESQIRFSQLFFAATTSIIFAFITNIYSEYVSRIVFGSIDYSYLIRLSGIVVVLRQMTLNFQAVLQARRDVRGLSNSNLLGLLLSASSSVLVYFLYGIDALFYAVFFTHLLSCSTYAFYALRNDYIRPNFRRFYIIVISLLKPGIYLFSGAVIQLLILIFIRNRIAESASVSEVGLLNAGLLIMNSYVGLVLSALGSDYLPRLSTVIRSDDKLLKVLYKQYEVILIIVVPILVLLMVFSPSLVTMLFTRQFVGLESFIRIFVFAALFKSLSWVISYVYIAKSKMNLFFWSEIIFNIVIALAFFSGTVSISISSVAISFTLAYMVYFIVVMAFLKSILGSLKLFSLMRKLILPLLSMGLLFKFENNLILNIGIVIIVLVNAGYKLYYGFREVE